MQSCTLKSANFLSIKFATVLCKHAMMVMIFSVVLSLQVSDIFCQTKWEHHANNPALKLGASGSWDDYWLEPMSIIRKDSSYHMWYFGANVNFNTGIGHAISSDGINWQRHKDNPILTKGQPGAWDEAFIGGGAILLIDETFNFWFWGRNNDGSSWGIGLATSSDGITWTEYENNPVIPNAPTGTWDDFATLESFSILFDGERYHMWFGGCRNEFKAPGYYTMKIGYATSPDGITWTPFENNPVLEEGKNSNDWDYWKAEMPTVVKNHAGFHMWFHGDRGKSQIGYAHSDDGFTWSKWNENPVLSPRKIGSWVQMGLMGPIVLYDETDRTYKMWYMGGAVVNGAQVSQIGYATAPEDSVAALIHNQTKSDIPDRFSLYRNYPNPFNPSTTIQFIYPHKSQVRLEIYNILGHKVKTLVNEERATGHHTVVWYSEDDLGQQVPAGIYIARLTAGDAHQNIKLTLIK